MMAIVLAAALASGTAAASDKPVYAPVPAWVKPAPPIDASRITDDAPVVLMIDNQQRLEGGRATIYVDSATRAASPEVLGAIGTIQLPWQPDHGDLIIHRAEIIRGAERIDLIKGGTPFTVLRREQQLDRRVLDGMLTATMPVEGLRVGDVLHMTFSITLDDPTLKGNVQSSANLLFDPFRVQFARVRVIWPAKDDVRWRAYTDTPLAEPQTVGDMRELTITLPLAKQRETPNDAPARFYRLPVIEATSFTGWDQVAAVMAPLYATPGLIAPGSPLAAEVARIMAADSDPLKRTAAALQLVQDKVRYQLMGMGTGNYVPQTPAQTWSLRYGDCKAKTLLLLAILHAMKIDAEPVLAHTQLGGLVPDRLPSAGVFDHILVRADIGGESLWLDGTGSGARLADIRDAPPFRHVLPVRASGAALIRIPDRANARPDVMAEIDLDETAGIHFPAPFKLKMVMRGGTVPQLRIGVAQGTKDQIEAFATTLVRGLLDGATLVSHAISFDDQASTATLIATGIAYPDWPLDESRLKSVLDGSVADIKFAPDRARPAWRDIPVATGNPSNTVVIRRIRLPAGGADFTIEGEPVFADTLAGTAIDRRLVRTGDILTVTTSLKTSVTEIAAADIPEVRKRLTLAAARPLRAVAPASYPAQWQGISEARRAKRFDSILAGYTARIAAKPDQAERYTDRAWFHERIYDRPRAIEDLTRAIAIEPTESSYLRRAGHYLELGDVARAKADAAAALKLEPGSVAALSTLANVLGEAGDRAAAIALLQERIDTAGDDKPSLLAARAAQEAEGGDRDAALATIDAAIAQSPGKPDLLNQRCWIKGTLNTALDTALKDCTKAIELSDSTASVLDSRAMVYFRLNRMEDALADLDAALTDNPDLAPSLYMRGIIRKRIGNAAGGAADLAAARTIMPRVDTTYARFGIAP